MPRMDGLSCLRHIRQYEKQEKLLRVPVVLQTGKNILFIVHLHSLTPSQRTPRLSGVRASPPRTSTAACSSHWTSGC
jgi:hypothetical protein